MKGYTLEQVVAVLQNPVLQGENLTYRVKVLEGEMPVRGDDVSIFIDVIGMPPDTPFPMLVRPGARIGALSFTNQALRSSSHSIRS